MESDENPYNGLREQALRFNTGDLGISGFSRQQDPFGVIFEFKLSGSTVTMVALITGDASIYFSSGGVFIGGGHRDNAISHAAIALVKESKKYVNEMTKTQTYPFPEKNEVIFYILTDGGVLMLNSSESLLQNKSINYWKLYYLSHDLIGEYRKVSEKKQ